MFRQNIKTMSYLPESLRRNYYQSFNEEELFKKINKLNITQEGDKVVTYFGDREVSRVSVSKIYEIFDFKKYMIERIGELTNNFKIVASQLSLSGGIQELTLLSDKVKIGEYTYYKAFFILNSTNKYRRLSINLGLYQADNNTRFSINNLNLSKKHYVGITDLAENVSEKITEESFNEQVEALRTLIGQKVLLSNVQKIIFGDKEEIPKSAHTNFDNFKRMLLGSSDRIDEISNEQRATLRTPSESLRITPKSDFAIDAFKVFNCYIRCFENKDSHVIVRETEKIMQITQYFIRQEKIRNFKNK